MKLGFTVGVYEGDDLVDNVTYAVSVEPVARIFAKIPEDSVDVSVKIDRLEVLYE